MARPEAEARDVEPKKKPEDRANEEVENEASEPAFPWHAENIAYVCRHGHQN